MKKKLLILGGKPIGSRELVKRAHAMDVETVVADYLPIEESPAKLISDEHWEISTACVDELATLCKSHNVSGVVAGVHEFNIVKMLELGEKMGYSTYCTREQWEITENKTLFKGLCRTHEIPVAKTYEFDGEHDDGIVYPVITKPTDSSGSRGFSICRNKDELAAGYQLALKFSVEKKVLVEEFVDSDACIVHYTAIDGDIHYSAMSDKVSMSFPGGSRVMALQMFPSKVERLYLDSLNEKVISMLKSIGMTNGPIWIEIFNDIRNERFVFNEASMRFGGSMTNYPVKFFTGVDQMSLILKTALDMPLDQFGGGKYVPAKKHYCILPIHLRPGRITAICGERDLHQIPGFIAVANVHFVGDIIEDWGTAQQVYCYLHLAFDTVDELAKSVNAVLGSLKVIDANGENLLYTLYDTKNLLEVCV